jgi:nitroreductase
VNCALILQFTVYRFLFTFEGMNQVIKAIKERRAVKYFDPNFQIPAADFDAIIDAARNTPSSFNIQHWRIVRLTDQAQRAKIRALAWDQSQITDASEVLVICADVDAFKKQPNRYWENAPQEVQNTLVPMLQGFYENNPQLARDEALRSSGLFAQTIMLAAKSLGYDSCPMIGFDIDGVSKAINLPTGYTIGLVVVIGKALKPAQPKGGYLPVSEILVENSF